MRLVWHSNSPTTNSGYGKQSALFIPRIVAAGHEIAAIASPYTFGGCPITWNDIPVLGTARDVSGNDVLPQNHEYFGADWTVVLADAFALRKCAPILRDINVAMWTPVDCSPLGVGDVTVLRESQALPIAMSRFGQQMLADEGCLDPLYIPHGVDMSIYKPGERSTYRETVPEITDDTFVIGVAAMNKDVSRKAFQEQFLAFAEFHRGHPDSFLAVHSSPGGGTNLQALAARLGISAAVGFPDSYSYDLSLISEENMATWYNGLDVLSLCSYGEGFGLPLIEAQACGIPVITTDASAMSELCGAGWLVSGTPFWQDGHQSWWVRPDAEDIANAYELAYEAREAGQLPQKPAFEFAQKFAVDRVFEDCWVPVLAALEERIG